MGHDHPRSPSPRTRGCRDLFSTGDLLRHDVTATLLFLRSPMWHSRYTAPHSSRSRLNQQGTNLHISLSRDLQASEMLSIRGAVARAGVGQSGRRSVSR